MPNGLVICRSLIVSILFTGVVPWAPIVIREIGGLASCGVWSGAHNKWFRSELRSLRRGFLKREGWQRAQSGAGAVGEHTEQKVW